MWTQITDRRYYFGAIILFLIGAITLLILFPGGRSFFILNGMYSSIFDAVMPYLTHIGDGLFAVAISVLLIAIYRINFGLMVLLGTGLCGLLTFVCKTYIFTEAPRPKLFFFGNKFIHYIDSDYYVNIEHSFPSGHSLTAFFVFTLLALSFYGRNILIQLLFASLAIVAALSRVYLAHHFVGDITAGAIMGTLIALLMYCIYTKMKKKKILNRNIIQVLVKSGSH